MIGYYDSDMFSAMAPMFILYFLIKSTIDFNLKSALFASLAISIYPFLYDQGRAIIFAMGIIYALYLIYYHRTNSITYKSLILIFLALTPFKAPVPYEYLIHITVLIATYFALKKYENINLKDLIFFTIVIFLIFLTFGDVIV